VNIHEASRFWTTEDIRRNVRGYISNIDFKVQGPLFAPRINGPFLVDSIQYKSVLLTNAASNLNLVLMLDRQQVQIKGEIIVNSGLVKVRNVDLPLSLSKIIYQKDIANPRLDIHLGAKVEDMDIHLAIKGDLDHPQLIVSSDPPMTPQDALRVLFTGNAWVSSTSPFNGVSSSQLAQDFLNYSLEDINGQQFGLKTKLTDNLKLGVEMDQIPTTPGETNTYYSRKIEGEMDMNNHMSLNISKEVLPQDRDPSQSVQGAEQDAETQIYLQYKKRF
jgi:hypothetical protein